MLSLFLIAAALAMATLAALFAILTFFRGQPSNAPDHLTKTEAIQIFHSEIEVLRRGGELQSRELRTEITENLSTFQNSTVTLMTSLSGNVHERTKEFGEQLERSTSQIDKRVEGIAEKLNRDLEHLGAEATANRDGLRALIESKLDGSLVKQSEASTELRGELSASFERLSRSVAMTLEQFNAQQKERLDDNKKSLDALAEQHLKAQESLKSSVETRLDAIRSENSTKLEEMRATVDEKLQKTLESRLDESFSKVVDQMTKLYEQLGEMKSLASNVGSLNNALSNVKIRGTFGEVQLALLIEEFLTPDQYVRNAAIKDDSREQVEFAIKFKVESDSEELLLPVDAKFPREDYDHLLEAFEAGDSLLVQKFKKQLENRIKACAKDIRDKYINPPRTTDFAILFLPTESLYAEVLRQPGLFETLQREYRVTLAGPTTFSAILNAFRMNFHSLALAKQTSEVWRVLSAVRTEFGRYNKVVSTLDKQLRTASNSVENLGRRTRAMDRKLRTVDFLTDDGSAQALLGLTDGNMIDEANDDVADESTEAAE